MQWFNSLFHLMGLYFPLENGTTLVYAIPYSFNGSLFFLEKMGPSAMVLESVSFNGSLLSPRKWDYPLVMLFYLHLMGLYFPLKKMGPSQKYAMVLESVSFNGSLLSPRKWDYPLLCYSIFI